MFRALTLSILMTLVFYVLFEDAGIAKIFNENTKSANQTTVSQYHEIEIVDTYEVSLLNDPKVKEFKIYRGAMKKSAVDRMKYIGSMTLEFSAGATDLIVEKVIKAIAKKYGGNVAIIDLQTTTSQSTIVDVTEGRR